MRMFFSPMEVAFLSSPYAMAAAVGSLMILMTLSPAMIPASLVACLWESLKYAGTVTTALLTVFPKYCSAVSFILVKIMELISSAMKEFLSPLMSTSITGLSPVPETI